MTNGKTIDLVELHDIIDQTPAAKDGESLPVVRVLVEDSFTFHGIKEVFLSDNQLTLVITTKEVL
jgi:hypothetical protein